MDGIQATTSTSANATGQAQGHHRHGHNAQEMFKKLDTNGDGSVDLAELQAAKKNGKGPDPAKMMQALDTNGDGKIDAAENEAGMAKLKEKFAQHRKQNPQSTQSLNDALKQDGGGESDPLVAKLQSEIQMTTQYTEAGQETNSAQGLVSMQG